MKTVIINDLEVVLNTLVETPKRATNYAGKFKRETSDHSGGYGYSLISIGGRDVEYQETSNYKTTITRYP